MATRKRNRWLDEEQSEDDEQGYNSEAREESRTDRAPKRPRLLYAASDQAQSSYSSSDEDEDEDGWKKNGSGDQDSKIAVKERSEADGNATLFENQLNPSNGQQSTTTRPSKSKRENFKNADHETSPVEAGGSDNIRVSKPLSKHTNRSSKTGVIYISRVPPFMKPHTLKSFLSPFGEVGRIFLTPEDPQSHRARVRSGGNKKRSFTDGWVEFLRKRDAKVVAETLNTRIIGGKKGGFYHDDVWNIKYLKGFKWSHLTEQIANENAERAARLRQEIGQTTKENKRFIQNVERAKMLEGVKAKRRQKQGPSGEEDIIQMEESSITGSNKFKKHFRQTGVKGKSQREQDYKGHNDVQRVLSKIF